MLDDQVRAVLERLARADADERERGLPSRERMRSVAPTTGQFLFSLVAPQTACEVLEIGASHGYSSIWFGAAVRYLGGRVVSIEHNPQAAEQWRQNVREAGLEEWMELLEGDALELLPTIEDVFDVVFIDAEHADYERHFEQARRKLEPGGLVVADNILSHREQLEDYVHARQSDPHAPLDHDPARPRFGAVGCPIRIVIVGPPRKGGGPTLSKDSGSGGTRR